MWTVDVHGPASSRGPQSAQSVPYGQLAEAAWGPPSWREEGGAHRCEQPIIEATEVRDWEGHDHLAEPGDVDGARGQADAARTLCGRRAARGGADEVARRGWRRARVLPL